MSEKAEELYDVINYALTFALANIHTTVVCKVTEVGEKTISCQPVINRVQNEESKPLPEFIEVPPIFMNGGSSYEAWPITVGDYCLLFISERCYDAWYFGNDFVKPVEMRMHDYSDGFALIGIKNEAGAIAIPDVITRIGDMYAEGNWELVGNLTQTGNQSIAGQSEATIKFAAPILQGVLQGVGGGNASSDAEFTATKLHAGNGWSGTFATGDSRTVTVVDGIITGVA